MRLGDGARLSSFFSATQMKGVNPTGSHQGHARHVSTWPKQELGSSASRTVLASMREHPSSLGSISKSKPGFLMEQVWSGAPECALPCRKAFLLYLHKDLGFVTCLSSFSVALI